MPVLTPITTVLLLIYFETHFYIPVIAYQINNHFHRFSSHFFKPHMYPIWHHMTPYDTLLYPIWHHMYHMTPYDTIWTPYCTVWHHMTPYVPYMTPYVPYYKGLHFSSHIPKKRLISWDHIWTQYRVYTEANSTPLDL